MEKLVSILIPVYNREQLLQDAVQSALAQTYQNIEVVIADNASTDNTWAVCQELANKDRRIRIFQNSENIGPVRNWIRCAQEAHGEYSKILFSDDCLAPDCLAEMVPKLDDPTVALVYCAAHIGITMDEATITYSSEEPSRLNSSQYVDLLLCGGAPVSPGAILIRTKDLLNNLHTQFPTSTPRRFEKHGAGPDVMISLLTAKNYPSVIHISEPLVFFRAHAGSFTISNTNNEVIDGYRSAFSYYLKHNNNSDSWISYLAYHWLQRMKLDRKWINPSSHLREYEGSGSLGELLELVFFSLRHVINKVIGKKLCFIK